MPWRGSARSFPSARASIWRTRSFETPSTLLTCTSVCCSVPLRPNRSVRTSCSLGSRFSIRTPTDSSKFSVWGSSSPLGPLEDRPKRRFGSILYRRQAFGAGAQIMEHVEPEPRLSQMSTHWTVVFDAHTGTPDQASWAVSELECRYSGAVHRYFLKAVRDPNEAEELDQEFAIRFLRGDFRRCHPERSRFRDYVKRAVQNMINDHFRRKKSSHTRNSPLVEPA